MFRAVFNRCWVPEPSWTLPDTFWPIPESLNVKRTQSPKIAKKWPLKKNKLIYEGGYWETRLRGWVRTDVCTDTTRWQVQPSYPAQPPGNIFNLEGQKGRSRKLGLTLILEAKTEKKVDWQNRPRAGFSQFSTRNRDRGPESIIQPKSTTFCGSFALLSSSKLHLSSYLCTME